MPNYLYTARDESGHLATGTLLAADREDASKQLRAERKYPISIKEAGELVAGDARPSGGIKVTRGELIHLSTQLSIMLETGVTLTEAMGCIGRQAKNPKYKALATDLCQQVEGGSDFSAAISKHPRSFPRLYISLMRAAEKSGMMSKLLLRATTYLRDEQDIVRRVKGALTYPCIMLAFAVTTTTFLLAFVLPRFASIYASKGAALPVPTQILMSMSNALVHHWLIVSIVTSVMVTTFVFFFRSAVGRQFWHTVQLEIPVLGEVFRKLHLSRSLRMMGTLSGSGVNLLDCVENTIDATTNNCYRTMWTGVSTRIKQGKPMSEHLSQSSLVPSDVAQMLQSGESSGKLAMVMEQVATYAEAELKEKITELTRYIEPAMIIIMGLIIGGVALALMLPVFTMGKVVAS